MVLSKDHDAMVINNHKNQDAMFSSIGKCNRSLKYECNRQVSSKDDYSAIPSNLVKNALKSF